MPQKASIWNKIEDSLNSRFSIRQFMYNTGLDKSEKREARNILNQFVLSGKIRRISQNLYEKIADTIIEKSKKK